MTNHGLRIGIDVGGTNTDAALMDGRDVVATAKASTTADVRSGVVEAVTRLLDQAQSRRESIHAVMIGTTQFVNAFVQRQDIEPVATFRVSLPKADGVPPMATWPDDLVRVIGHNQYMVGGGSLFTGKDYAPLDEDALRQAATDARDKGIRAVAISANFSPIRPDLEERAAAIVSRIMPEARITLSHKVGGLGLVERENSAIINAALGQLASKVISSLKQAFADLAIRAPLFVCQNDGTLIPTEMAEALPILTCSAGPTNSVRGAAFLTGLDEAIVADIGGTTTDIGFLKGGFPRETTAASYVGGVRTNFRMPDVLSVGMGGGSIIEMEDGLCRVGPRSVGYRLRELGLAFGGSILTATDVAISAGQAQLGDKSLLANLPQETVNAALHVIHTQIEDAIDRVKTSDQAMPLILVGGGHILVSRPIRGASQVLRPAHAEVANAVGAAIALVSGRSDKLYDTIQLGRDEAVAQAKAAATQAAVEAGALASQVEIVDLTELPMTHMRTGCVQIKARAVGPLAAFA